MTSDHADAGVTSLFYKLLESSRKLVGRSRTAADEEIQRVSALIEKEIIPRLQMTFASPNQERALDDIGTASEYDVDGFVNALRNSGNAEAFEFIESLRDSDHNLLQVYRHLLAPAARRLGDLWENDEVSFTEVTVATTKIRYMAIATAPLFPVHAFDEAGRVPRILITTVPGEQHTMGVHLSVEAFRSEGWSVWSGVPRSTTELVDLVAQEHYDVIGLSVSANRHLPAVAEAAADARRASLNPNVRIVLGGGMATRAPEKLAGLGVDLIASDLETTLKRVRELVPQRPQAST